MNNLIGIEIMSISASMVKELRERTGAGMMECKKALVDSNGDLDAAIDLLRTTGQAKAEKKAKRGEMHRIWASLRAKPDACECGSHVP